MKRQEMLVKGMHCKSCKLLVEDVLEEFGAKNIEINLDEENQEGKVSFESDLDAKEIIGIIKEETGYEVEI